MRGQRGFEALRANVFQVARSAGRLPKGYGVVGDQPAAIAPTAAGCGFIDADRPPLGRQNASHQRPDVVLPTPVSVPVMNSPTTPFDIRRHYWSLFPPLQYSAGRIAKSRPTFSSRRRNPYFVPQGRMTIAQRFIAGERPYFIFFRKSRRDDRKRGAIFDRPYGTDRAFATLLPSDEIAGLLSTDPPGRKIKVDNLVPSDEIAGLLSTDPRVEILAVSLTS